MEFLARGTAEVYASWFRALSDATRVQILELLARHGEPMRVGESSRRWARPSRPCRST